MHALTECCCQTEHGVIPDFVRNVFVAFPLVTDMDESVINTHLEFGRCLISATLVFVELFQALKRY